ncbi:hypothetical protein C8T65DRAFT_161032 [Cerioporus squamosus]|nr:hypothetical protein C8T65DRAFT_161032 [Cerioporus squamosus]
MFIPASIHITYQSDGASDETDKGTSSTSSLPAVHSPVGETELTGDASAETGPSASEEPTQTHAPPLPQSQAKEEPLDEPESTGTVLPMQPTSIPTGTPQGGMATESPPSTPTLAQSSTSGHASPSAAAARPARTLVLCFDGTGDSFDADVRFRPRHEDVLYLTHLYAPRTPTWSPCSVS